MGEPLCLQAKARGEPLCIKWHYDLCSKKKWHYDLFDGMLTKG